MANNISPDGVISVKVKFNFDASSLEKDIGSLVTQVQGLVQEAFNNPFYIDLAGVKLHKTNFMAAISPQLKDARTWIAESMGKMGNTPVKIGSLGKVSIEQGALDQVGKQVSSQLVKSIEEQFKNVSLNLNGKSVNASQLVSQFGKQLAEIQKQAQVQANKSAPTIDPATIFTTKGKLRKNASLDTFKQYIRQETKEIESAYATLKQVLADGANLQPGTPPFAQMEAQATALVKKIVDSQKKIKSIKTKNPQLFDRSQTSGALELEQNLLRLTGASAGAQAELAKLQARTGSLKASSKEAQSAIKNLEQGLIAAKKAQENYNNAQKSGIGSAARKQYTELANQQKALANAKVDKYNNFVSSGSLAALNKSDTKLVTQSFDALSRAMKGVDSASNANSKSIDSLRSKYEKLVTDIDKAIASVKKYEGSYGQNLTTRLTALRSGVSKMMSQGRFDTDELAGFRQVYTNRNGDLGTLKSEASNYVNQLESVAGKVKQVYTDIGKTVTQMTKTPKGTQAFTDLENHMHTLVAEGAACDAQMQQLQATLTKFYGNAIPSKTQRTVDSAIAQRTTTLARKSSMDTGVSNYARDAAVLEEAANKLVAAEQKLASTKSLGPSHKDYAAQYKEALKPLTEAQNLIEQINSRYPKGIDMSMPGAAELKSKLASITKQWSNLNHEMAKASPATANLRTQYESMIEIMRRFESQMTNDQRAIVGKDLNGLVQKAYGQLQTGTISSQSLKELESAFNGIQTAAQGAGKESRTFTANLSAGLQQVAGYMSVTMLIMQGIQQIKQMIDYTRQLDTAMTELRKVTDVSEATYSRFLDDAANKSVELGATLTDLVTSTGDFARLGFSIQEAFDLSQAAITLKNVGDGIESATDASEKIISAMKAFDVAPENAMSIVDKYNEVGIITLMPIQVIHRL